MHAVVFNHFLLNVEDVCLTLLNVEAVKMDILAYYHLHVPPILFLYIMFHEDDSLTIAPTAGRSQDPKNEAFSKTWFWLNLQWNETP